MAEKILCVDDDPNVLSALQRTLRKQYAIHTAEGAEEGIKTIEAEGPFAVIVSDLRMPGMDGIQFLAHVKEIAPDSVRIMLTGHADLKVSIEAVNEGNIFRFLTKPCPPEKLSRALDAGIELYRLVKAEKELLESTLRGSVKVLSNVLSLVNPTAFGRSSRVLRLAQKISAELKLEGTWRLEIAAMLSQLGCVTVPEKILSKVYQGKVLSGEEKKIFETHPQVGHDLIGDIPRLEEVAEMIARQDQRFSEIDVSAQSEAERRINLGAGILKVALDFDTLVSSCLSEGVALARIVARGEEWYDPKVFSALQRVLDVGVQYAPILVNIDELSSGMVFAEDVKGSSGVMLIAKGQEVTPSLIQRLKNYAVGAGIREPLKVTVPLSAGEDEEC